MSEPLRKLSGPLRGRLVDAELVDAVLADAVLVYSEAGLSLTG